VAVPPPTPTPTPTPEADGWLLVLVKPWADVTVDGQPVGQTPLRRLPLRPGPHSVVLSHPDFRPYQRRVTIGPGETVRLDVDLKSLGVRRAR
jgi:serine/threonine-protein kinase